ncbi:MAG: spermidine synthase, partial [Pseudomonadota bacterium]
MEKSIEFSEQSVETGPTAANRHRLAIFSLMVASGFAGLGYEMVWTRAVTVALGHEIVSVLAVIAAFFAGLGIGAWFLDRPVRRSARPARWYAAFEFVIALWSVFLIVAIDVFNTLVSHWLGVAPAPVQHWLVAFGATFVLLLPATVAMGGTLPALQRVLASVNNRGRGSVAGLYAANTFGAVLGTLVTTMYLVPSQGLDATLLLLAGVNLCCALAALVMSSENIQSQPADDAGHAPTSARLGWLLAVTGFLGIGFEVIVIRVLSQVLENTVFTFASLLSVYLVGTAVGAAWFSRLRNTQTFEETLEKLVGSMAIAVLVGTGVLYFALPVHLSLTEWFGNGYVAAISGEMVLALLVFALPTLVMGALFSHLAEAARSSFGVGRALGVNTIAGALAPLMFGVFLLPLFEAKLLLLFTAVAYPLCVLPPKGYRSVWASAPLLACSVAMVTAPALRVVRVPEGGELLSYTDGVMASVAVVADARGT